MNSPSATTIEMKDEQSPASEAAKTEETTSQPTQKSKKAPGPRRRTKTGCLTCRVRRIKCDEARPTCKNCTKSRRDCQGYQPSVRLNTTVPTTDDYTAFASIQSFHHSSSNPADWVHHPFHPLTSLPMNVGMPSSTFQHVPAEFQHHGRHDWAQLSHMGGMLGYNQGFTAGYPDYTHVIRSSNHMPHMSGQAAQHVSHSHYPDHPPTLINTDHTKFSSRSSPIQSQLYHPQPLPAHFHAFSFSDDYEDPSDPWDIEAEDGYPWYHLGMAMQRRAAQVLSPILQERNAFLLHHFVNFVRPCVYLYERRPVFDSNGRITSAWGSTLPSAAISHPALGHAILGLSALHLAILYGNSDAAARKHILLSTKSIGKLLGEPDQRHKTEALACVLLLAFYEVMDAEHSKWVMHLSGAASFLTSEHDWIAMTRNVYQMRARAQANLSKVSVRLAWSDYVRIAGIPELLLSDEDWGIDQDIVAKLTGQRVDYLNPSLINQTTANVPQDLSQHEAEEVVTKIELFWWLTKQLVFQSLLSGDPLLVPYQKLLCCPPRGRLGSNLIGTIDHLWLILARIADFGGKDRLRKQKCSEAKSKPPPVAKSSASKFTSKPADGRRADSDAASKDRGAPSANESRARIPKGPPNTDRGKAPKMMYGMIPPAPVPISMMSSFHLLDAQLHKNSAPNAVQVESPSGSDLDKQTAEALSEHAQMAEALDLWRTSLGDQFQALPGQVGNQVQSPFGPARRFGDPVLACCWAFYYLAKIMLQRFHPHNPPAMVVSAIANADLTKDDAFDLLKIYWGILCDQKQLASQGSINPSFVAALQELSFPLIFVAVHVEEAHQRTALIESFLDMERDAGWKSASASASACETFWVRLYQIGKGAPYERTVNYAGSQGARRSDQRPRSSAIVSHYNPATEHESRFISHDRKLIDKYPELRTYWAVGLLSVEEDFQKLSLSK